MRFELNIKFAASLIVSFLVLAIWCVSPGIFSEAAARPQNPAPSRNSQTRTEKIVNPLNDLLDEAQRDIDKKDFAAAIEPLRKVITEEPNIAFPHFQLAYVFTALQRNDEARAEYERVIAIDPKMSAAYLNLGDRKSTRLNSS